MDLLNLAPFAALRAREWDIYNDITVYDRATGELIKVPYPTQDHDNTTPILPAGVSTFFKRRGMEWECECAGVSDFACSVRWVTEFGRPLGLCANEPPMCRLYLDLNILRWSTSYYSCYSAIPTLSSREADFNRASSAPIVIKPHRISFKLHKSRSMGFTRRRSSGFFLNSKENLLAKPLEMARARYRASDALKTPPGNQLALRQHSTSPAEAEGSNRRASSEEPLLQSQARSLMAKLMNGEGLTKYQHDGLTEQCDSCDLFFLGGSFLREHVKICAEGPKLELASSSFSEIY